MKNVQELEEALSRPSDADVAAMAALDGDLLILGVSGKMGPSLAESWTESPDGKTYEFKLRPGLKFHNGDAVTAEDVKFSFQRYKGAGSKALHEHVAEVEIVDPRVVRFHLREPWPDFMTFYGTTATAASAGAPGTTGGGNGAMPAGATSGSAGARASPRPAMMASAVPPMSSTRPTARRVIAAGRNQPTLMPGRASVSTPLVASAFMTTTVHSPLSTSRVRSSPSRVVALATQKS